MKRIIESAKKYKYTSLAYVDEEDIINGSLCVENGETIFLYVILEDKIRIYWACNTLEGYLEGIKETVEHIKDNNIKGKSINIGFVPYDFVQAVEKLGFKVICEYIDFWNDDLTTVKIEDRCNFTIREIKNSEYEKASTITKSCAGYSRGFKGESVDFVKEWNERENSKIFVALVNEEIIGVAFIDFYGFESERGTVLWLRELAVNPNYHSQGIGRALINKVMCYGKESRAKRSFLATDKENYNAIGLYEKFGYKSKDAHGEIDMEMAI